MSFATSARSTAVRRFTETLVISDEWLAGFIGELSADESPYFFSVIPVEILGIVYEHFPGKVVHPHPTPSSVN